MKGLKGFCPALWFSGFFGAGALVHAVRGLLGYRVTINEMEVPMTLSVVLFVVFAVISGVFGYLGCNKPCQKG